MSRRGQEPVRAEDLRGFRYFRLLGPLLERLHPRGAERDRAGNRRLFYDQYVALLLMYFFTPALTSLRGLQQATGLDKVAKALGVGRTSLGALSEAAGVFDPALMRGVLVELTRRLGRRLPRAESKALADLVAVDGTLLPALPRMAWALWQDPTHRAAKAHVAVEVLSGLPVDATITAGNGSERAEWRKMVRPGGFYVADRGYVDYSLMRELDLLPCRFLVRLQDNAVFEPTESRPIAEKAKALGVVGDVLVQRLGTEKHNPLLKRPWRVVTLERPGRKVGTVDRWTLATNDVEMDADLVALAYRNRWQVELFFRWLKAVLGMRHLILETPTGVALQVYAALIVSVLIAARTGLRPTKRTYEMIGFYLSGWASAEELAAHLAERRAKEKPS
ncbi:IS4 family transposase [Paludisphaera rhizosphaerae]|uniref:IS4 family transposase n=1 Tax=Paludisphaera rhizosphaerae TaxID=2711216 RepID=UPI0013ECAF6C|nr:IS4 family transposase [Paludisphaera rhizosphaerae]